MNTLFHGKMLDSKKSSQGFTLIELMITISILAILMAIAIPSYRDYVRRNSEEQARQRILTLATELDSWRSKKLSYSGFIPKNKCPGTDNYCYSDSNKSSIYVPLGSNATNYKYQIMVFSGYDGKFTTISDKCEAKTTYEDKRKCETQGGRIWYMIAVPNRDNSYLANAQSYSMDSLGRRCSYNQTASSGLELKDFTSGKAIPNGVITCTGSGVTTW